MRHCLQRVKTLDKELEKLAQSEDYREVVGILRCFFGIETLTAISIIAEVFDFGRFASARAFMSYLGLTPSESSSGEKEHKGRITKTGPIFGEQTRNFFCRDCTGNNSPHISHIPFIQQNVLFRLNPFLLIFVSQTGQK